MHGTGYGYGTCSVRAVRHVYILINEETILPMVDCLHDKLLFGNAQLLAMVYAKGIIDAINRNIPAITL